MTGLLDDDLLDEMARCLIPILRSHADRDLHNERRPTTCIKVDCVRPLHAAGMCGLHYNRALKRRKRIAEILGQG